MRAGTGLLVAQALNSVTNFAVAIALARELSGGGFGTVGVVQAVTLVFVVFTRGIAVETNLLAEGGPLARRVSVALGGAAIPSTVLVLVALALGFTLGDLATRTLVPLAIGSGLLCAQDALRTCLSGIGRPLGVLRSDVAWAAVQLVVSVALVAIGTDTATAAVIGWASGALAATVVGLSQVSDHAPRPVLDLAALRRGAPLGIEYLVAASTLQLTLLIVALLGHLSSVGALRGAIVICGPATLVSGAVYQLAVGRLASEDSISGARLRRASLQLSLVGGGAALSVTVPLLLLPRPAGVALLGATWDAAHKVLPLIAVQQSLTAATFGPQLAMRRLGVVAASLRFRLALTPAILLAAAVAAVYGDARSVAAVVTVGAAVALVGWAWLVTTWSTRAQGEPMERRDHRHVAGETV